MTTPGFLLLCLAGFRLTRLIGWDDLTARPRDRLTRRGRSMNSYRPGLDKFLHCPWCVGFWVALALALAWWAFPRATLAAALPFALSAVIGLLAKNLDP